MHERINCRELIELLDDYVEQRLAGAERARFDDHLGRCPACRRYLMGYQGTMRAVALACAPDAATPPEVPGELIAAILASRRAS